MPFAVLIRSTGERGFRSSCRLMAHLPFRLASTASFIVAGFAARSRRITDARPRLLGFDLEWISRAVRPADPAIAFTHRVAQIHQPGLPWALFSSFGFSPPARGLHF